jgi:hypothetical protein
VSFTPEERHCYNVAQMVATDHIKVCKTCGGAGLIALRNQKVISVDRVIISTTAIHNCLICPDCFGRGVV